MHETRKSQAIRRRDQSGRRVRRATAIAGAGALVTGGLLTVALGTNQVSTSTTTTAASTHASDDNGEGDDGTTTTTTTSVAPASSSAGQGSATTSGGSH